MNSTRRSQKRQTSKDVDLDEIDAWNSQRKKNVLQFRTFSEKRPYVECKKREMIVKYFVKKNMKSIVQRRLEETKTVADLSKKEEREKKGDVEETNRNNINRHVWDAELRRRKRLRECKEISAQYEKLQNQAAELRTDRARLRALLRHVVKTKGTTTTSTTAPPALKKMRLLTGE